jgi:hypothetical protein
VAHTRKDFVDVAQELNKLLDPEPPIDVSKTVNELKAQIIEAAKLVQPDDVLSELASDVLKSLKDGEMSPEVKPEPPKKVAKAEKTPAAPKEPKAKAAKPVEEAVPPKAPELVKVKVAKLAKAPKEAKASRSSSKSGKDPKPKDEFRPLRKGTIRGNIFDRMDGTRTISQIADELQLDRGNCSSHVFCLWRDCGIGFSFADGSLVKAVLPVGVSDAFRAEKAVLGAAA